MQVDLRHIAKLARLRLEDSQVEKFEKEMEAIVQMVQSLPPQKEQKLGADPQNPMELRPDVIEPSLRKDKILQNAPKAFASCFEVPKTVE